MSDRDRQGYTINLEALCETRDFSPKQVESAMLVYPRGAVPNPMLLWLRVQLVGQPSRFITLPLTDFYKYVELPPSNLGGLVSGD